MKKRWIFIFLIIIILILGIIGFFILNRCIGCDNQNYNVEKLDNKIKDNLEKSFMCKETDCIDSPKKMSLLLKDNTIKINNGNTYGIAFAIKNIFNDTNPREFSYNIVSVGNTCNISYEETTKWVIEGKSETKILNKDELSYNLIKIKAPEGINPCIVRYNIAVLMNNESYYNNIINVFVIKSDL